MSYFNRNQPSFQKQTQNQSIPPCRTSMHRRSSITLKEGEESYSKRRELKATEVPHYEKPRTRSERRIGKAAWPPILQSSETRRSQSLTSASKTRLQLNYCKQRRISEESFFAYEKGEYQNHQNKVGLGDLPKAERDCQKHVRFRDNEQLSMTTTIPDVSINALPLSSPKRGRKLRRHSESSVYCNKNDFLKYSHNTDEKQVPHGKGWRIARRRKSCLASLPRMKNNEGHEGKYLLKTQCSAQFAEILTEIEQSNGMDLEAKLENLGVAEQQ